MTKKSVNSGHTALFFLGGSQKKPSIRRRHRQQWNQSPGQHFGDAPALRKLSAKVLHGGAAIGSGAYELGDAVSIGALLALRGGHFGSGGGADPGSGPTPTWPDASAALFALTSLITSMSPGDRRGPCTRDFSVGGMKSGGIFGFAGGTSSGGGSTFGHVISSVMVSTLRDPCEHEIHT